MTDSKTVVEDLAAWLTQIWDEEERLARAATDGPWLPALHRDGRILGIDARDGYDEVITTGNVECMAYCYGGTSTIEATDADWRFIAANHPASVLARIAADRKILALHMPGSELCFWTNMSPETHEGYGRECFPDGSFVCETLSLLASPYADRPGFRPEWSVERQGVEW